MYERRAATAPVQPPPTGPSRLSAGVEEIDVGRAVQRALPAGAGGDVHHAGGGPAVAHPEAARIKIDALDQVGREDRGSHREVVQQRHAVAVDVHAAVLGRGAADQQQPEAVGRAGDARQALDHPQRIAQGARARWSARAATASGGSPPRRGGGPRRRSRSWPPPGHQAAEVEGQLLGGRQGHVLDAGLVLAAGHDQPHPLAGQRPRRRSGPPASVLPDRSRRVRPRPPAARQHLGVGDGVAGPPLADPPAGEPLARSAAGLGGPASGGGAPVVVRAAVGGAPAPAGRKRRTYSTRMAPGTPSISAGSNVMAAAAARAASSKPWPAAAVSDDGGDPPLGVDVELQGHVGGQAGGQRRRRVDRLRAGLDARRSGQPWPRAGAAPRRARPASWARADRASKKTSKPARRAYGPPANTGTAARVWRLKPLAARSAVQAL